MGHHSRNHERGSRTLQLAINEAARLQQEEHRSESSGWDEPEEHPDIYWQRKLDLARAKDKVRRLEQEHQALTDNAGGICLGRPFLVRKP